MAEVLDEVYALFIDLDADESQIDFPIVLLQRQAPGGRRSTRRAAARTSSRCSRCWSPTSRRRPTTPTTRCRRSSPTSTPRPTSGGWPSAGSTTAPSDAGQQVAWCRARREIERGQDHRAVRHRVARPGRGGRGGAGRDHRRGRPARVTIGETLADPDDPRPLPVLTVDEPSLVDDASASTPRRCPGPRATSSPPALIKSRLDAELVGNVVVRVLPTERPDTWEVQGRGELQLAVLVEIMRREGFELTVGKPQVVTTEIDGRLHEPVERRERSTCPRTTSASSPSCSPCARAAWSRWSTTAPAGSASSSWSRRGA